MSDSVELRTGRPRGVGTRPTTKEREEAFVRLADRNGPGADAVYQVVRFGATGRPVTVRLKSVGNVRDADGNILGSFVVCCAGRVYFYSRASGGYFFVVRDAVVRVASEVEARRLWTARAYGGDV